jgi:hypothetical protein
MKAKEIAVLIALSNAFENKKFDVGTGIKFTVDVYKLAVEINKKQKLQISDHDTIQTVIFFIKEIAKGDDGIMGTRDDLIDTHTLNDITKMLETNLLEDLMWVMKDSIHFRLDMKKTSFCLFKHLCIPLGK